MEKLLFQQQSERRPMHVAVFGSGTGTILRAMLAAQKSFQKPSFAIRLLYTDRECSFQKIAQEEHLPLLYHSWSPLISREEHDRKGLELLRVFTHEQKCPIDFLLLAGYMRLLSKVWLQAFPYKILNIHPADLTVLDAQGNRKWIGENAVFKALQEGMRRTRTAAILIDEKVDGGPILVSGPWVDYQEGNPIDKQKAAKHQAKQKALSDWPACLAALQLIGEGRIKLNSLTRDVFLDGKKMPSCGYELKEGEGQYVWNHRDLGIRSDP